MHYTLFALATLDTAPTQHYLNCMNLDLTAIRFAISCIKDDRNRMHEMRDESFDEHYVYTLEYMEKLRKLAESEARRTGTPTDETSTDDE